MDENRTRHEKEFMEILPDDFEESRDTSRHADRRRTRPSGDARNHLFIAGAVAILLLVIVIFVTTGGKDDMDRDLNVLEDRIRQIEEIVARYENAAERITQLENRQKDSRASWEATKEWQRRLQESLEALNKRLEAAEKGIASLAGTVEKAPGEKQPERTQAKAGYHEVRKGDTLYGIAREYGIGVEQLCRLNKISPDTAIRPGQKLLVVPLER